MQACSLLQRVMHEKGRALPFAKLFSTGWRWAWQSQGPEAWSEQSGWYRWSLKPGQHVLYGLESVVLEQLLWTDQVLPGESLQLHWWARAEEPSWNWRPSYSSLRQAFERDVEHEIKLCRSPNVQAYSWWVCPYFRWLWTAWFSRVHQLYFGLDGRGSVQKRQEALRCLRWEPQPKRGRRSKGSLAQALAEKRVNCNWSLPWIIQEHGMLLLMWSCLSHVWPNDVPLVAYPEEEGVQGLLLPTLQHHRWLHQQELQD